MLIHFQDGAPEVNCRKCVVQTLHSRLEGQGLGRPEIWQDTFTGCINNSSDACRTASASFVSNKANPQINRVRADFKALVSPDMTLN